LMDGLQEKEAEWNGKEKVWVRTTQSYRFEILKPNRINYNFFRYLVT
jgi:hypothetical protein